MGIDNIDDGEIIMRLVIFDSGKPCLANIFGTNISEENIIGHDSTINSMPYWTPARQRDTDVYAYVIIKIKIANGEIESVE